MPAHSMAYEARLSTGKLPQTFTDRYYDRPADVSSLPGGWLEEVGATLKTEIALCFVDELPGALPPPRRYHVIVREETSHGSQDMAKVRWTLEDAWREKVSPEKLEAGSILRWTPTGTYDHQRRLIINVSVQSAGHPEPDTEHAVLLKRKLASDMEVDDRSQKRQCVRLGEIAAAAVEQWGLDADHVVTWALAKGLPGVGIADLEVYRREHPEEDLAAGLLDASV